MAPGTKRIIAGLVLTLLPFLSVYYAKQSSWGSFQAIPKARQLGDSHARVYLVEYSDFQCPMCAKVQPSLPKFRDTHAFHRRRAPGGLVYSDGRRSDD